MTYITIEKEKVMLALEALEDLGMKHFESTGEALHKEVFDVLKEALASEQEHGEWVGLTGEEIDYQAKKDNHGFYFVLGALWAEVKLKEKNERLEKNT